MMIKGDSIVSGDGQNPAKEYVFRGSLTAATTTAVGGVLKLKNTTGYDLIIRDMFLDVITVSTGAATVDAGVDDGGDVSSDILFDGLDVNTAAGLFNVHKNAGTNGKRCPLWKADEYVVATASATTAGMVGKYTIVAIPRA